MSAREWHILSWLWLGFACLWIVLEAPSATRWATLIAAIIARGVGDILKAIERSH